MVTTAHGLDYLDSHNGVGHLEAPPEPEESTMKSAELLKIGVAIATVAMGLITYSLIVALQATAVM